MLGILLGIGNIARKCRNQSRLRTVGISGGKDGFFLTCAIMFMSRLLTSLKLLSVGLGRKVDLHTALSHLNRITVQVCVLPAVKSCAS